MALSVPFLQDRWDRKLPNPALLLNGTDLRRSSSLLQHQISSDQFLTPAAGESGRRNTVPCIPASKSERDRPELSEAFVRGRQISIVSSRSLTESSSEGTSPIEPSDLCLCVPEPKIPRPRNAFILYRQHQHNTVVQRNPGLPNPDISKIIGEQWRQLSPKEKAEWQALAEQEKARHSQQFPDYRYRPKRSGRLQQGDTNIAGKSSASCEKCGGRTINPPHTPHYPPNYELQSSAMVGIARGAKRAYTGTHVLPPRVAHMAQPPPMPHTAPMRYGYGSMRAPRHDSFHYIRGSAAPPPSPPPHHYLPAEEPEIKRRRMESYSAHQSYDHQYPERESHPPSSHPDAGPRHSLVPTRRIAPPGPPQTRTPTSLNPPGQAGRDTNLTLPPLRTAASPHPISSPSLDSRGPGTEGIILSYPVLNKLKTLQNIALVAPESPKDSLPTRKRGTVIAVEGLDPKRVYDMTASLVEQLEKDGSFAVKVFSGPDPYSALQIGRRASAASENDKMTTEKYLNIVSAWHKVSKEIKGFITTKKPRSLAALNQVIAGEDKLSNEKPDCPFDRSPTRKSPISAVSPGTRNADRMQLDSPSSPAACTTSLCTNASQGTDAMIAKEDELPNHDNLHTEKPNAAVRGRQLPDGLQKDLIPVAIVPHFQLTTVDACSIALPITDNYDPLTHWRWHATLWRGCVGADFTIVIKSPYEQHGNDAPTNGKKLPSAEERRPGFNTSVANPPDSLSADCPPLSATGPAQAATTPYDVEVRLQDCRAIIVQSGPLSRQSNASDTISEREFEKSNESWDKAKRRVGFEIEETLRR